MFRRMSDFTADWREESESTLKVFRELTDASLSQRVTDQGRSLGTLAWHITTSIPEMFTAAGVPLSNVIDQNAPQPSTVAEIIEAYEQSAAAVAEALPAAWTDDQLEDKIPMYGEAWTKGFILSVLVKHQTHHRAQMTVLMRQAGLNVPGIYGPSRDEWSLYGMATPA